ncbi:DUF1408 domain-containing protein, partial [Lactococcus lactis]
NAYIERKLMETTIINGRKVRLIPTPVGQIYHDLIKRENRGVVVFETWERPDGSLYMTSRKKNKQELAADKAAMLNECISDWKKVWN